MDQKPGVPLFGEGTSGIGDSSTLGQSAAPRFGCPAFNQPPSSSTSTGCLFEIGTSSRTFSQLKNVFGDNSKTLGGFGASTSYRSVGTLFGTNSMYGCSGFPSTQQPGTTVKFNPLTGSEMIVKAGISTNISTNLQCITAMKEYETKSQEELRLEDYQAGRKGPANQVVAGTSGLFGSTTASTTIWATTDFSNTTGSLFGQQNQQEAGSFFNPFGQTTTGQNTRLSFGNTNTMGQSTTSSTGLFGNTAVTSSVGFFGTATTSATMGFGTGTLQFGQTSAGFENTSTQNLFGNKVTGSQTTTSTITPSFGATGTIIPSFGGSTTAPSFGTSTIFLPFGGTDTNTPSAVGVTNITAPSFTTTTTPFSGGRGLFGHKTTLPVCASTLGFCATPAGGSLSGNQPATVGPGTNFGTAMEGGQMFPFGNDHNQQGIMPEVMGIFGMTRINTRTGNMGLSAPAQQPVVLVDTEAAAAQQTMLQQIHSYLTLTPYGDTSLFRNPLSSPENREDSHQQSLESTSSTQSTQYNAPPPPIKTRPKVLSSLNSSKSHLLFYLDDDEPKPKKPFRKRKK